MRITQIMLSNGWGGAERFFVELCLGLAAEHQILVVCRSGFAHGSLLQGQHNIRYATLPALFNWDYWSVFKFKQMLKEFRPHIIHAHLARASWMAGIVGSKLNMPTVSTTHNRIKKKYINKIGYFTTITNNLKNYIESFGIGSDRIRKIPNFSLIEPTEIPSEKRHNPLVFFSLGRFVSKKGFDVLLQAFKQYSKTNAPPAKLMIAGSGPLDQKLRHQAAELGIADLVEFSGWIDDVPAFCDKGDIFILPSRDEPFGIVLLESMSMGKPIIATSVSGPLDFLDDQTAFFVTPGDSEELSKAMQAAATSPEACHSKALEALRRFRAEYTREAVLPRFIDFYEEILKSSPQGNTHE